MINLAIFLYSFFASFFLFFSLGVIEKQRRLGQFSSFVILRAVFLAIIGAILWPVVVIVWVLGLAIREVFYAGMNN